MPELALAYPPAIGILAWSARRGGTAERWFFGVNMVLLWASAVWLLGYPALILPALGITVLYLSMLVTICVSGIGQARAARRAAQRSTIPV